MAITLDGFKTAEAVVDWVAFVVELRSNSNGGHIKNAYEHLGVSHAIPINKGLGGAANKFEIRLQHPSTYVPIDRLLCDLNAKYGLSSVPKLVAVEVSIDLYHDTNDASALEAMTKRLMNSISPAIINNPRVIGDRFDLSERMLPFKKEIDASKTLYIGDEQDDVMWRIYWKRTDDTFVGEDGQRVPKPLLQHQFRSRVEVRLRGNALKQLRLFSVTDLYDFSFEKLHSVGLFKFAKRNHSSGPIFTNLYAIQAAGSLGIDDSSPACVLNMYGRRGSRGRGRKLNRHLVTDTELTETSRLALIRLSRRFSSVQNI